MPALALARRCAEGDGGVKASHEAAGRAERVARLRTIRITLGLITLLISTISLIVRCSASSGSGQALPVYPPSPGSVGIVRTLDEPGHAAVTSVAFSPDSKTLATCDTTGTAYLWNVATGRRLAVLANRSNGQVLSAAFSPSGKTLAVGDANGTVDLWRVATGAVTATLAAPGAGPVNNAAYSPDGKTVAAAD